ncbi:MAG: ABC transporter ATP-binding protein [Rhodobacteraceae bacterium]|nr:ABC transporter ATP-binding protein [Paracoccaceae bacterium]
MTDAKPTGPVVQVTGLTVDLGRDGVTARVLDGVGFAVNPGEIVALVGESGSGKSTIGKAIQGLLPKGALQGISGSIRLAGQEIVGATDAQLRKARAGDVRAVPQNPMGALNPTMKVGRQMRESGATQAQALDWLARMGLPDPPRIMASYPSRLSGGQRQRALIAMAMVARPKLLIADEPTTALDVTVQAQILDLIAGLRDEGTAVLFVTHDLSVAAHLADRILVCYAGTLVEDGPAAPVIAAPRHPYTGALLRARFDLGSDRSRPLPVPASSTGQKPATTGCPYRPRCARARPDCADARPPLTGQGGRRAACLHPVTAAATERDPAPQWPARSPGRKRALELFRIAKSFPVGKRDRWGRRGMKRILDGIDLVIDEGECVALVGESGSGKSTLLRIAAGLETADDGQVARAGNVPPQVIFQDAPGALTPWLGIGRQIGERLAHRAMSKAEITARVTDALQSVGLDPALATALPSELSGGQCQRATVARALIDPPRVLLCDEPISAMDVSLAAQTLNLLNSIRRDRGLGMLFVTHDLAAARLIADRIAVLEAGRLVEQGPAETVIAAPQAPYTKTLVSAVPRLS